MTLSANEEVVLEGIHGNAMELELEIDPKSAPMVELNVLRSPQKEEFTRIAFFRERGLRSMNAGVDVRDSLLTIDSSYSSIASDVLSVLLRLARSLLPAMKPSNYGYLSIRA